MMDTLSIIIVVTANKNVLYTKPLSLITHFKGCSRVSAIMSIREIQSLYDYTQSDKLLKVFVNTNFQSHKQTVGLIKVVTKHLS